MIEMRDAPESAGTLVGVCLDRNEVGVEIEMRRANAGDTITLRRPFALAFIVGDGQEAKVARVFRAVRR
jgi:hypothetical protein